ncbi:3-phosphoglycerate dehydrogenase [Alphaproteobacteria bacterium GH1-50]|uniref:3-phosphoglycerate dehydrogenase n=1 Tax=Kangsaoukella pontilimi TaxID=2691042 RepID=A0A7C9IDW2_9RHOB|nr:hydroxyacid dehydrogenase [Kangsaoukella pontilimi]MXQ06287.1 3-phosphoglycerate dehydrogenase [Kangsaoukella pontilimi]
MRIVISEFMDETALAAFGDAANVDYDPSLVDDRPALIARLSDADGLIVRNRTQVDAELLDAAPSLKVVGRLGVGLDNIDLAGCKARGVEVCPATGANAASVAEYVIAMAFVLLRDAYDLKAEMLSGAWPRGRAQGREIAGRTMGLIGFGMIAQEVARRARALGMGVIASDPMLPRDHEAWDMADRVAAGEVLSRSDVISLHVPLTPETRGLIGAEALSAIRSDAVLINTARGGVVDEAALAFALKAGRLAGAALDVFEDEPLSAAAAAVFDGCPNLILTPHIAGVTSESNVRVSEVTVANVKRVLGLA